MREFRLIFGSMTSSSAVVIAIFMGGLGLGNAFWGSRLERTAFPLATYAKLELGIAIAALLSPALLALAQQIYWNLGGVSVLGESLAFVVRLGLSVVVLGAPTFLMGGTLPAVSKVVVRAHDAQRRTIAWLYAFNTLGAVAGTALATFLLLERLGSQTTLLAAVVVNIVVAAIAFYLSRSEPSQDLVATSSESSNESQGEASSDQQDRVSILVLYSAAFWVGAVFFVMEMVWYRMLGPLLGGTTYTFGLILCVALAGIGVGGAIYSLVAKQRAVTFAWLALTCCLEALLVAVPIFLGDRIAFWLLETQRGSVETFSQQIFVWAKVAALVVGLPALVAGFQFPLLIGIAGQANRQVAQHVGWICAFNTAGAIIGSIIGGLLLLPWLGAIGLWKAAVVILIVMALVIQLLRPAAASTKTRLAMLSLVIAISLVATLSTFSSGPTAVWRHAGIGAGRAGFDGQTWNERRNFSNSVLRQLQWEVDGWEASVAVTANDSLSLVVNGKSDGNAIADVATQVGLGVLGPLLHDRCERGLVVGLGTGESAGWLAQVSGIKQVDVVEMEPAVERVARECAQLNGELMNRDNVDVFYNDAREFLMTTPNRYDLIVSEPSNPYRAGVANLYTRDFYEAVAERLESDGLFLQWLQGYEVDDRTVRMVFQTLLTVFPHMQVWATSPGDMVIVCSRRDLAREMTLDDLLTRMQEPTLELALRRAWRVTDVEGLAGRWLGNEASLEPWLNQGAREINTDDRNLLEYAFAKTVGKSARFVSSQLRVGSMSNSLSHVTAFASLDPLKVARREQVMRAWYSQGASLIDSPERDELSTALRAYFAGEYSAAAQLFASIEDSGICPIEALLRCHLQAELGQELPTELLAQVERTHPVEAHCVQTIAALKRNERDEATKSLLAALAQLRDEPWGDARLLTELFGIASEMPQWNPSQVAKLEERLREPFSLRRMDETRRMVRLIVAESLDVETQLAAFDEVEPHVPWREWLLNARAELYGEHRPELASKADRESLLFLEAEHR